MGKKKGKSANKRGVTQIIEKIPETDIKETEIPAPAPETVEAPYEVKAVSEEEIPAPVAAEEAAAEEDAAVETAGVVPEEDLSLEQELFGTREPEPAVDVSPAEEPGASALPADEPSVETAPAGETVPAAEPRPVFTSTAPQPAQAKADAGAYSQAAGAAAKAAAVKAGQKFGKVKSFFGDAPITRKFLTIMVIGALVLNAALTAGLAAIFAHDGKDKPEDPKDRYGTEQFDYDDDEDFDRDDFYDDWNHGHNGSQDDYQDYYQSPYDDRDDDWDDYRDDDEYEYYQPYPGDQDDQQNEWSQQEDQSQQSNQNLSNVSIGIVITENNGVYVSDVTGENATKAGFKAGDKIVSFDGTAVTDSNSLISAVQKHKAGDKVKVVVERDGKKVNIKTELQ